MMRSANANLERFAWLGDRLAIAVWTRDTEEAETVYDRPGHHTLSCYLDGGYRTERQKMPLTPLILKRGPRAATVVVHLESVFSHTPRS